MADFMKFLGVFIFLSVSAWTLLTLLQHMLYAKLNKEEIVFESMMKHLNLQCRHASLAGAYTAYRNYYKESKDPLPPSMLRKHYSASHAEWLAHYPR